MRYAYICVKTKQTKKKVCYLCEEGITVLSDSLDRWEADLCGLSSLSQMRIALSGSLFHKGTERLLFF